jgi:hypothetical protein
MPFCVQQQLQQPSHNIRHKFCKVAQDSSSSQRQWILKPPVHFSNSTLQRGTTHQLPDVGPVAGKPVGCQLGACVDDPAEKRSITTALDMRYSFLLAKQSAPGKLPIALRNHSDPPLALGQDLGAASGSSSEPPKKCEKTSRLHGSEDSRSI